MVVEMTGFASDLGPGSATDEPLTMGIDVASPTSMPSSIKWGLSNDKGM